MISRFFPGEVKYSDMAISDTPYAKIIFVHRQSVKNNRSVKQAEIFKISIFGKEHFGK